MFDEVTEEKFAGLDIADVEKMANNYESCEFLQCNFQEADLRKIRFTDCVFLSCNFSLSQMKGASFHDCRFQNCKMLVIDWTSLNSLRSPQFLACVMTANNFSSMQIPDAVFSGSLLKDTRFREAKLRRANFSDCDLEGAEFGQCDLRDCDFRQARNYRISPLENQIKKAKFSLPEAISLLQDFGIELD